MDNKTGKVKFLDRWTPKPLYKAKTIFKESGIKGIIRHFGWKICALFFMYYLIRDLTIYVLLPWYFAKKLF
ncbi:MAG: hypothetical protein ACXVCR_08020 [Bdellovibrio sp.]